MTQQRPHIRNRNDHGNQNHHPRNKPGIGANQRPVTGCPGARGGTSPSWCTPITSNSQWFPRWRPMIAYGNSTQFRLPDPGVGALQGRCPSIIHPEPFSYLNRKLSFRSQLSSITSGLPGFPREVLERLPLEQNRTFSLRHQMLVRSSVGYPHRRAHCPTKYFEELFHQFPRASLWSFGVLKNLR